MNYHDCSVSTQHWINYGLQILMAPSWHIMLWSTINDIIWHPNLSHPSITREIKCEFCYTLKETNLTQLSSKSNVFRHRDVHLFPTLCRFRMSFQPALVLRKLHKILSEQQRLTYTRPLNLNARIFVFSPDDGRRNVIPLLLEVCLTCNMLAAKVLCMKRK